MKGNKNPFWAAVNKTLAVIAATLIMALILAPAAWAADTYKILHEFTGGADGSDPTAGLIFDAAGNLYGTAKYGGSWGQGTVFELTPNSDGSWTETVLYNFSGGDDGGQPFAGVTFDRAGNLYGTTYTGGAGDGTVFELTRDPDGSWTETVLHSFTGSDGRAPVAGVIFGRAGSLYGTTTWGGTAGLGTVFELTPNSDGTWTEKVLHSFTGGKGGSYPDRGSLVFDAAGNLYGAAADGGQAGCNAFEPGCGVIYELTPNSKGTWREKVLYLFSGEKDGYVPEATLVFDKAGNLYGSTWLGGSHGAGNVFELVLNADGSWKHRVLHQFNGGSQGPMRGVILRAGKIYGTKGDGGSHGFGYVFELVPNADGSWTQKVLHQFTGEAAAYPWAVPIFDAAGNLYGTASEGGPNGAGAVFEITP